MNNLLKITLPDKPQAKQRSRKGKHGNWYNPQSDEMEIVKKIIKEQLPENFKIIDKNIPVIGNVYWFIKPSKTMATKKFIDLIQNDDIPHIQKPDRDNLDKYNLDCMSKIVFADDCQVYGGEIYKFWSMNPRTEIEIIWSDK
jgi:Holliday junction resolvase RusA-like endonuclease